MMWPSHKLNNTIKSAKIDGKKDWNSKKLPVTGRVPSFPIPKDLITVIKNNLVPFPHITRNGEHFLKVLKIIKDNDESILNQDNYVQILKLMLYLEENQNNLDMRQYDIFKTKIIRITNTSNYYKIYVDGLMEDRPSIRPYDTVEVMDVQSKTFYILIVTNVMDDHIIVTNHWNMFHKNYLSTNLYNIRFSFGNYTFRCAHYALFILKTCDVTSYFFPEELPTFNRVDKGESWFNQTIKNNPEQKQAVLNIVDQSSSPAPYILYGPPGTGKTSTLVEAICQAWRKHPSKHILVCTPCNAAADVITKRLLKYIDEYNLYRMYSLSKEKSQIDSDILNCSNIINGTAITASKEIIDSKRIVITTLCTSMKLQLMQFPENHFAYIFIDEAGQSSEPETLIPCSIPTSVREGRLGILHSYVVISGDPQQLGPGIRSKLAEPILGVSMMERLMSSKPYTKNENNKYNSCYITKLVRNYRSHPSIIHVPNQLFYESELSACGDESTRKAEEWKHLKNKKFPIIFHGVEGNEMKDTKSPSVYNTSEIDLIIHYVKRLLNSKLKCNTVKKSDIGVITPFSAQRFKLQQAFEKEGLKDVDIGTVELFQGQEKEIIIISTVRTKKFYHNNRLHLGFLSNPKRFNVAITRAKALLIIVGNPMVLQIDKYWSYFLQYCKINNACCGTEFCLQNGMKDKLENKKRTNNCTNNTKKSTVNKRIANFLQLDHEMIDDPEESNFDNSKLYASLNSNQYIQSEKEKRKPFGSKILLSDIPIKKMSELKLEKALINQNKRKKETKIQIDQ